MICSACGSLFEKVQRAQKYCSSECRPQSDRERDRNRKRDYTQKKRPIRTEEWCQNNLAKRRLYRKKNAEKIKLRDREWAKNNKNKRRASSMKWYMKNKDKARLTTMAWKAKNQEKVKIYDARAGLKRKATLVALNELNLVKGYDVTIVRAAKELGLI